MLSRVAFGSPAYLRRLVRRSVALWLLVRIAIQIVGLLLSASSNLPPPYWPTLPPLLIIVVASLVAALLHIDAAVVRETTFHANLGTPRRAVAVIAAVTVLAIEAAITLVAGAGS